MINIPSSEMLSYRPAESFFLAEANDYIRASVTDELPRDIYTKRYSLIHEALIPFSEKKAVATGPTFLNGDNSIYGMSSQTLLQFAERLRMVGIEPWQVAFDEQWRDDGINPYQVSENQTVADVLNSRKTNDKLVQGLKEFGYSEGWPNTFPHVNLHHLLALAKKNPNAYFASHNQELHVIPVPGVQFFRFRLGGAVTIQDQQQEEVVQADNWETHWGDRYNEEFKQALRQKVGGLDTEGKIGDIIMDLGCGENPVSAGLTRSNQRVILVDKASRVKKLRQGNRYPIQYDIEKINDEHFAKRLQDLLGISPKGVLDSVIMSDVLNYVDWKDVLRALVRYMKKGGRFIINNMPDQGYQKDFSSQKPRDNLEIVQFLQQEMHCSVEEVQDAAQVTGQKDISSPISRYSQVVLVARLP